jgi:hypothetical protein
VGAAIGVTPDPPAWQPSASYAVRTAGDAEVGSMVKPTAPNGRLSLVKTPSAAESLAFRAVTA